jgi:hypothetical protein
VASRAWWVLLVAMGPLVGVSFISAAQTYAEASGLNGTSAGVGEAFSPLVGIWAPTFSACELAAAFLLPFVAIRQVSADRQSGALKLELQHPMTTSARIAAKAVVLFGGWIIASLPTALAALLWRSYGGSVYVPELVTVFFGHLLNAGLTIALAAAAAMVTEHPSTAAILTLTVTVGTWILNFIAAVQGGFWERAAGYTPTAMVAEFQHGLVRLDVMLVAAALIAAGLSIAAIWMQLGVASRTRAAQSAAILVIASTAIAGAAFARASWDTSEARLNSFPEQDEQTLRGIRSPVRIEVHLAPEDPRRIDFERRALVKLKRILPDLHVTYISATSIGLFEQTNAQYGEIWYEINGRTLMNRVTTAEGVVENIYDAAGITPPAENEEAAFHGHPLAVPPRGAAAVFYGLWPGMVLGCAVIIRRLRL